MKIGIMQPYFFPYIGYWQLINAVDKYVIYDDVNYIKGGWINRNRILINDKPSFINLKMNGSSPNKLIKEIHVSNDNRWKNKLLKSIELSYRKAPFFEMSFPIIEEIINHDEVNLSLYLENLIKRIAEYLEMNTEFVLSSNIEKDNSLKGQDKVIEICKSLGAKEYYNAIGGVELYSAENFNSYGIELKFLRTEYIEYKQFKNDFSPYLSIIDVMMFNSKEEIMNILDMYSLT
ncbi:MAG: WbqC family protein [Leptotrichiaceae bacterium]